MNLRFMSNKMACGWSQPATTRNGDASQSLDELVPHDSRPGELSLCPGDKRLQWPIRVHFVNDPRAGTSGMKLPRDLSGEEVCRALVRLGLNFDVKQVHIGSYAKGGLHPCVPMHREIRPKTLQSILKTGRNYIEQLLDNLDAFALQD